MSSVVQQWLDLNDNPIMRFFWVNYFERHVTSAFKARSQRILGLWSQHCEYIIANRIRRGQQMICMYRRFWDDQAFRGLLQQLRKQVSNTCQPNNSSINIDPKTMIISICSGSHLLFFFLDWSALHCFCILSELYSSCFAVKLTVIAGGSLRKHLELAPQFETKRCVLFYVTLLIRIDWSRSCTHVSVIFKPQGALLPIWLHKMSLLEWYRARVILYIAAASLCNYSRFTWSIIIDDDNRRNWFRLKMFLLVVILVSLAWTAC